LKGLDTYRKITLGEYRALREKGAPKAIPTMCVLTIKKDNISSLFAQNQGLWHLAILKNAPGVKAIALHLFFVKIPCVSLLALLLKNTVPCKATAKTRSAMVFSRPTKQRLFTLLLVTPALIPKNIGFC